MTSTNPQVFVLFAVSLAACAPAANSECFESRPENPTSCFVLDGGVLAFNAERPLPDIDELCKQECIDFPGFVSIEKYTSLTDVPLLAKMRHVRDVSIHVDTLTDLRGLEAVRMESLVLQGNARRGGKQPPAQLTSLEGLRQNSLRALSFFDTYGVLSNSGLDAVEWLTMENVAATQLDFSAVRPKSVSVVGAHELTSIRFGGGSMTETIIEANSSLTSLDWDPALRISGRIRVLNNELLSSCRVQEFVSSTSEGRDGGSDALTGNGPCP